MSTVWYVSGYTETNDELVAALKEQKHTIAWFFHKLCRKDALTAFASRTKHLNITFITLVKLELT